MYPHNGLDFYHMMRNQWKPSSKLAILQNRKLTKLINHVYHTVPYYHNLFDYLKLNPAEIRTVHDLQKIPTISSKTYRKLPLKEIVSKKTKLNKCVIVSTNGTTGSPLNIYFTRKDHLKINLNWVRPLLANGVRFFDKRAVFVRPGLISEKMKWYQYLGFWRNHGISIFDEPDVWIEKLMAYRPHVIHGYSMSLKLLAQAIKKRRISRITPRILFGVSELLDDGCRELVSDVFQTRIVDLYGAAETGCIAWECPTCSMYHLNVDTVVVEFLNGDERVNPYSEGRVVVTNLHSFAMPIIRYELNDIAIPISEKAVCGRGLPSMKIVLGRSDDFVALPSGKLLSPRFFSATMREVVCVDQWRVEQDDAGCITFFLVPSDGFSNETIRLLKQTIIKNTREKIRIEIQIVDEITMESSGKLRSVASKVATDAFR